MQVALASVLQRSDLIADCDHVLSNAGGSNSTPDDDT